MFAKFQKSSGGIDYIIVGLGNNGKKYENTRHNAGFMAVDHIAEKCGVRLTKVKFQSQCAQTTLGGASVLLMKPNTFMNLSGQAVAAAMKFYKIPPEKTLIIFDDISLEPGVMRIRKKGSHGGQNGMRNIINMTDSDAFPRIKIGIGAKPNPNYDLADWVLSRFSSNEKKKLESVTDDAYLAAELIVQGKIEQAMGKYSH